MYRLKSTRSGSRKNKSGREEVQGGDGGLSLKLKRVSPYSIRYMDMRKKLDKIWSRMLSNEDK